MGLRDEIASQYSPSQDEISRAATEIEEAIRKYCVVYAKAVHKEIREEIKKAIETFRYETISGRKVIQKEKGFYLDCAEIKDGVRPNLVGLSLFENKRELFASFEKLKYVRVSHGDIYFSPVISKREYMKSFLRKGRFRVTFKASEFGKIFFDEFHKLCQNDEIEYSLYVDYRYYWGDDFCDREYSKIDEEIIMEPHYAEEKKTTEKGETRLHLKYNFIYD